MTVIVILSYGTKTDWNRIVQNSGGVNRSFQSFGEKNIGKFIRLAFSYLSESGIWLGKKYW